MEEINALIAGIPDILIYIVPGYLYLYVFYFVSLKNINDCNNVIIKCAVASYGLILLDKLICNIPFISWNSPNIIRVIIYAIVMAYLIGIIKKSKWFNHLLKIININRTTNANLWDDIHEKGTYLWVVPEKGDSSYLGQTSFCGEGDMSNIIVLTRYQELTMDGEVKKDYSKSEKRKIMLDTTKCLRIELFYEEKMNIIEALKMIRDSFIRKIS